MQYQPKGNDDLNPAKRGFDALKKVVEERQAYLSDALLHMGPDDLRQHLNVAATDDWNRLYSSLISGGALRRLVLDHIPFFVGLVVAKGPLALRRALRIEDSSFDKAFENVLDLVGISHGALYSHVEQNRDTFASVIMKGEGKSIRHLLGITSSRYDHVWGDILELLTGTVCDQYVNDHMLEDALKSFSLLMNSVRTHRSLRSFKKMWKFEKA